MPTPPAGRPAPQPFPRARSARPSPTARATPSEPAEPAAAPADALDFDVVPVQPRKTGWTAYRQRLFIRTLAETCSVTEACEAAGVDPRSAYRLRRRPGAESFDRAWAQALQCGIRRLTDIAFERATIGRPRAVFHKGKQVGEVWEPSDMVLIHLLRHYDRARYGNLSGFLPYDVPNPVDEARAELPGLLDELVDHPVAVEPGMVESYQTLWDEE